MECRLTGNDAVTNSTCRAVIINSGDKKKVPSSFYPTAKKSAVSPTGEFGVDQNENLTVCGLGSSTARDFVFCITFLAILATYVCLRTVE